MSEFFADDSDPKITKPDSDPKIPEYVRIPFVTGNSQKHNEVNRIVPCKMLKPTKEIGEMQGTSMEVALMKAHVVLQSGITNGGPFMIEDSSLELGCMSSKSKSNGNMVFPGPYVKHMMDAMGDKRVAAMVMCSGNNIAVGQCIIVYWDGKQMNTFVGRTEGVIVAPSDGVEFGWDRIFIPDRHYLTYVQMSVDEKNKISDRGKAARLLSQFLK